MNLALLKPIRMILLDEGFVVDRLWSHMAYKFSLFFFFVDEHEKFLPNTGYLSFIKD